MVKKALDESPKQWWGNGNGNAPPAGELGGRESGARWELWVVVPSVGRSSALLVVDPYTHTNTHIHTNQP